MRRRLLLAIVLMLVLPPVAAGHAETRVVPQSREQITLSFAPLVKRAAPAVVNIYSRRIVRDRALSPLLSDPFFQRFFGDALPFGMPRERVQNSLGSGVIVSPDGLIVTNHHVIQEADEITVVLADRREFAAELVTSDARTDLAVLRIDPGGERLPVLELRDSDTVEVGDLVLAIGNPFGVGQTVTSGIVSAVARTAMGVSDYNFFIQTDAAINPGNSGGALIGMDGRLIGINTAIYSRDGGSLGIGFAIPSNMVRVVLEAVRNGGRLVRPWLGVESQRVTADIAASLGLARPVGALVNRVHPKGPAAAAGVRMGDVITAVNGLPVDGPEALRYRIATLPMGSSATLTVLRDGQTRDLDFTVAPPPEDPPRDVTELAGRHPLAGAVVANLSPALVEEEGLEAPYDGVVVLGVAGGSPADRIGLRRGDLLLAVNEQQVATVRDLVQLVQHPAAGWRIAVQRGGRVLTTMVGG